MFKEARLRLTAWYLVIIMSISLSFSAAIYTTVNRELTRMDNMRKDRQNRVETMQMLMEQRGFPPPVDILVPDSEGLEQSRIRIITILGIINSAIFLVSGLGGYFLAGQTLDPISKMMVEQKKFVGDASHELRTPLTSLKTEIEVALRDKNMKLVDARKLLKSNLEDVNKMQKLSNYLLKLNKYENGGLNLKKERVNLGQVVSDASDSLIDYAGEKGIKIVKNIDETYINGDKDAINELATIFIDNAIKYSGKSKKVEVSVKKGGFLAVRDYGIGIGEDDTRHIFDRFYRVDSSRSKEKIDGFGLGLSIAKSISDELGAKVKVESKAGKGSIFSVQFPTV